MVKAQHAAAESATAVNAHAYTVGSNVVFQRDKYDPSSADGKVMLEEGKPFVLDTNLEISTALPCRISLYEEGGVTKLATINFTGESASGWQQATFTNPVPMPISSGACPVLIW